MCIRDSQNIVRYIIKNKGFVLIVVNYGRVSQLHNLSLVNMFSELLKFKAGMTITHQYMNQLDDDIQSAVLGNAGTIISFRIGTEDAMYDKAFPQIGGWSTIGLQEMEQCELR